MPTDEDLRATCREPVFGLILIDDVFPRRPGDEGNPDDFPFSVRYDAVKEVNATGVVKDADPSMVHAFF